MIPYIRVDQGRHLPTVVILLNQATATQLLEGLQGKTGRERQEHWQQVQRDTIVHEQCIENKGICLTKFSGDI